MKRMRLRTLPTRTPPPQSVRVYRPTTSRAFHVGIGELQRLSRLLLIAGVSMSRFVLSGVQRDGQQAAKVVPQEKRLIFWYLMQV
jgi:hypothetical protein